MMTQFSCPVCKGYSWIPSGTFRYAARDHQVGGRCYGNSYVQLRRRVLFEVWFPDSKQVELKTQYCGECGFMCYTPRPDARDVDLKYALLKEREVDIGAEHQISERGVQMDRKRARRVFREIKRCKRGMGKSVLDIGGGDGKLLFPFMEAQWSCFLVDHNPNPRPGITRLGATVVDVPVETTFDVIICSHVIEHLTDPVSFLEGVKRLMRADGIAYLEVPLEIWKQIPIAEEPVTHINFFTAASFANLLDEAKFKTIRIKSIVGSYGGTRLEVVWAVARPVAGAVRVRAVGAGATATRLDPGPIRKLVRVLFVETRLSGSVRPIVGLFRQAWMRLLTRPRIRET
jgi:SAM-dependent methyltransferase